MVSLTERIRSLDTSLFDSIPIQAEHWDRIALLGLHAAVADAYQTFVYLEIGSYLGGSLQVLMQDPRCTTVLSIDPRLTLTPDKRADTWRYDENSTEHMIALISDLPSVDLTKLVTFETSTEALNPEHFPRRPTYCFIDGEHTDEAVLRDARFCASALDGTGVIAFHDAALIQPAIRSFVRGYWQDISFALAFTGRGEPQVFAVEFGGRGLLRSAPIRRAIASRWHSAVWAAANRWRPSARPVLTSWGMMPVIDRGISACKARLRAAPADSAET